MYNVQLEWITPSPRGLGDECGAEIEQLVSGSPRSSRGRTRPAKLSIMAFADNTLQWRIQGGFGGFPPPPSPVE